MYVISACLVGIKCRYNATGIYHKELAQLVNEGKAITVCPEVLGGMSTPRVPCEIQTHNGAPKVITQTGEDCSHYFERGAEATLDICHANNVELAILQSRSPSCGKGKIYNGEFSRTLIDGNGLTAERLINNGIKVLTEQEWLEGNENNIQNQ